MKFRFKKGEKVRIVSYNKIAPIADSMAGGWTHGMEEYCGKELEVAYCMENWGTPAYKLKRSPFAWDERALEAIHQFSEGDRVQIIKRDDPCHKINGLRGIIKKVHTNGRDFGVELETFTDGHDCAGYCSDKGGWWVKENELLLISPKNHSPGVSEFIAECRITLFTSVAYAGAVTRVVVKTGEGQPEFIGRAKCSPQDTWDAKKGRDIATLRATIKALEYKLSELCS